MIFPSNDFCPCGDPFCPGCDGEVADCAAGCGNSTDGDDDFCSPACRATWESWAASCDEAARDMEG